MTAPIVKVVVTNKLPATGFAEVFLLVVAGFAVSLYILPTATGTANGILSFHTSNIPCLRCFLFARRLSAYILGHHHRLILAGIAVSAFCVALGRAALLLDETQASSVMRWLAGSLENITWAQWHQFWPWVLLPVLPLLWLLPKLNLLRLSDEAAQSLGLSVRQLRGMVNVIVLAWVGAAVAITGPIAFLGLVAPHLARKLVGGRHIYLLPAAMLTGALILQVSDIAVRSIRPPLELPAGIFTALIGAPCFFYLLRRKH